jgi:kinesin family protein 5
MVKEEKEKGLWVQDATEVYVGCEEEMQEVFQIGTENRTVGNTKMNAKSSRSHSLFIVTIFQRHCKTDSTKAGKLYFVDLAGSEKISKTGVEGQLLEDAKNINKSLLMLGMVINSLTENKPYVPYRDSKLTRMLKESLGGNSLTTLIVTCSPNAFNDKESLSTLRFGQRAKSIKNKVVVNAEKSTKELLMKLNEAEEKIKYYQNILTKIDMTEGLNFSLKDFLIENKISIFDGTNKGVSRKVKGEIIKCKLNFYKLIYILI